MKAKIQDLMDLCRANEEAGYFDLSSWVAEPDGWWDDGNEASVMDLVKAGRLDEPPCGTYGCLVGNHLMHTKELDLLSDLCRGNRPFCTAADRYGLTVGESEFLFAASNHTVTEFGLVRDSLRSGYDIDPCSPRDLRDREAAIRRVRKLIYYKLRKHELCYEEDGRVKESARRAEGDHRIDRQVLAAC